MYEKCEICNDKKAVWMYIPGIDGLYCDDCVPRGCNCNLEKLEDLLDEEVELIKNNPERVFRKTFGYITLYEILDGKGRREPCCEYMYSEDGFN